MTVEPKKQPPSPERATYLPRVIVKFRDYVDVPDGEGIEKALESRQIRAMGSERRSASVFPMISSTVFPKSSAPAWFTRRYRPAESLTKAASDVARKKA